MKNDMAVIILLLFLVGVCEGQELLDVVYLKDGSKIIGTIVELLPTTSVKIRTRDGSEFVYTMDKVERIVRESPPGESITDLRDRPYWELGVNLGTPAGFNLAIGKWLGRFGLRVSGGTLGKPVNGIQINLGYKLSDNTDRSHSLAFMGGNSQAEARHWTYAGVAYNLNWGGFFLEVGLTGGSGSYTNPQAAIQIGYMYRMLD